MRHLPRFPIRAYVTLSLLAALGVVVLFALPDHELEFARFYVRKNSPYDLSITNRFWIWEDLRYGLNCGVQHREVEMFEQPPATSSIDRSMDWLPAIPAKPFLNKLGFDVQNVAEGYGFEITLPNYFVFGILLGPPSLIVLLWWRKRRTKYRGHLCPTCSYDLRAHAPGSHCPECGTRIIAVSPQLGPLQ